MTRPTALVARRKRTTDNREDNGKSEQPASEPHTISQGPSRLVVSFPNDPDDLEQPDES